MLVSIVAYQLIFGWLFSIGFVLLLLLHELGHVFQLRREGVKASAPDVHPLPGRRDLGQVDGRRRGRGGTRRPGRARSSGSIATLVPLGIWLATGSHFWQALAFIGFFLNLFNLLPILPLDGGRAMAALSPWVWLVGFVGLIAMAFFFPSPIVLLILLLGGMETWRRWQARNTPEGRAYHQIPTRTRVLVAATYLALIVALAVGVSATHLPRGLSDV